MRMGGWATSRSRDDGTATSFLGILGRCLGGLVSMVAKRELRRVAFVTGEACSRSKGTLEVHGNIRAGRSKGGAVIAKKYVLAGALVVFSLFGGLGPNAYARHNSNAPRMHKVKKNAGPFGGNYM